MVDVDGVCSACVESLVGFADAGVRGRTDIGAVRRVGAVGADWDAMLAACEFRGVEGNPGVELSGVLDQHRENEAWVRGIAAVLEGAPVSDGVSVLSSGELSLALAAGGSGVGPDVGVVSFDELEVVGSLVTSGFVNDPVNAATGNFVHADRDVVFPGFGAVLDVVRAYNSFRVGCRGVFGLGWSSLLDVGLDVSGVDGGVVCLSFTDGSVVRFGVGSDGGWLGNVRRRLLLEETAEGWVVSRHNGARSWFFDRDGVLVGGAEGAACYTVERDLGSGGDGTVVLSEVRSRRWVEYRFVGGLVAGLSTSDGRVCSYRYDGVGHCVLAERVIGDVVYEVSDDGFLVSMVDADGVVLFCNSYDGNGRVVGQVSPHGRETVFEYLNNGGTRITEPSSSPNPTTPNTDTNTDTDADAGLVNVLFHDDAGNLTALFGADGTAMRAVYDGSGRVVRHVDRAGGVTGYEYHEDDRLDLITRKTDPDGLCEERFYDPVGRLVMQRDRSGSEYWFSYEGDGLSPSVIRGPEGVEVHTVFNDAGLPVLVRDSDGVCTRFEFDTDGQIVGYVNGAGDRTAFVYDPTGQLVSVVDPVGDTVVFDLDAAGRVCTAVDVGGVVSEFVNTPAGRVLSMTTQGSGSWAATYGDHGDLATFRDAGGAVVGFGYDRCGNVASVTDPGGGVTTQQWDGLGLLTAVVDPVGNTATQTHDKAGRSRTVTDYHGRTFSREVDVMGRTTEVVGPDGARTQYSYHPNGELASFTNETGDTWSYQIDGVGRLVAEIDPGGAASVYAYTPASRLRSHTTATGRVYTYGYDPAGRLTQVTDPDGVLNTATIGPGGNLVSASVGDQTIDFTFDASNRVVGWHDPDRDITASSEWDTTPTGITMNTSVGDDIPATFSYDPRGLLNQLTDPSGIHTQFQHDTRGRVTQTTTATTQRTQTRSISYDPCGAISETTDPAGVTTTYNNTATGRLETLHHTNPHTTGNSGEGQLGCGFRYNQAGHLSRIVDLDNTELVDYTYNPAGFLTRTRTTDTDTTIKRDAHGSIMSVTNTNGDTTRYRRDADGYLTERIDPAGLQTSYIRSPAGSIIGYDDSQAGQITKPEPRDNLTKDRAGRISIDHDARTYTYDRSGRLEHAETATGQHRYTYNDLGLLATDTGINANTHRRFTYNINGQLTTLTTTTPNNDTETVEFSYDTAGRRTTQTSTNGQQTRYHWNNLNQLTHIDHTNPQNPADNPTKPTRPPHRQIVYSGLNRPETIDPNTPNETNIGWDDAITHKPTQLGTTRYLRDGTNTKPTNTSDGWFDGVFDDPWGYSPDHTTGVTLGYRGELTIDGLVFMGDRVYDPATRMFLSKDPLPPHPGANGAFGSDYAYAWCDPINHHDPTGREPVTIDELEAWKQKQETNRFQRAGQAIIDDPWGSLAMAGVVTLGVGLMVTGVGGPIGASILIGAAVTAGIGIATDNFNPRSVAIGGGFGAIVGGNPIVGAFTAGIGENLASQILVDGRGITELSLTEAVIDGTISTIIPAGGQRFTRALPTGTIDDITPKPHIAPGSGVLVEGAGSGTRTVSFRPNAADPNWGLTQMHLDKHLFGSGQHSLSTIDSAGNPALWTDHIQDLAGRRVTSTTSNGMQDIIGSFPLADGSGTFQLGIRLSPNTDGTFDLVTLLTRQ